MDDSLRLIQHLYGEEGDDPAFAQRLRNDEALRREYEELQDTKAALDRRSSPSPDPDVVDGIMDHAREAARPPVAFITAGAAPPVLDRHDIDNELASEIGDHISAGEFSEAFELVTPEMVDAFCMAGTVDEVSDRMAAVLDHADSIVVGSPLGPDLERAIDLAAEAYDRVE